MSREKAPPCPVVPEFNPFRPDQCHNPFPIYEQVRRESPVFFSPVMNQWVVTRYQDIRTILLDPQRFSSAQTVSPMANLHPETLQVLAQGPQLIPAMVGTDPPDHTRLRRLCNLALTQRRISGRGPAIRAFANQLIDEFASAGQADLHARFAHPLPKLVIANLVGVPYADLLRFGEWADLWTDVLFIPDLPVEQQLAGAHAKNEMCHYNAAMIAERRATPRDDLLSDLIHARLEDGSALSDLDLISMLNAFFIAGHKTTTDLIGQALTLLLRHPDRLQALYADNEQAGPLVEEVLRHDTPVPGMMRVTTTDVEVGDVTIPEGARVYLVFAAGNRDESMFERPDEFTPGRDNGRKHLGFGHGIHFCIGAPLARLEGKIALQVITERLANLRWQDGQRERYAPNLVFRGPIALPLRWDPVA